MLGGKTFIELILLPLDQAYYYQCSSVTLFFREYE